MANPVTQNLTILLTDIKGFTDKTSHRSRADIQNLLDKHKEIVLPVLQGKGGKLIKTIGDAFLMVFESPTDAVLAGIAVQEALAQHNADKAEDDRIEIRIAINVGEVNLTDNDIYGEPVNLTARIESVAQAGEVFFTEAVYLAMNKNEVPSSEVGMFQLKGIPEKVRVYKVKRENPVSGEAKTAPEGRKNIWDVATRKLGEPAPKAVPVEAAPSAFSRPKMTKRALAVFIDWCLCMLVLNMFWPGDSTEVHIKKELKGKSAVSSKGEGIHAPGISIDDNGIRVPGISIDDKGIHGPGVSIDDNGVRIGAAADDGAKKAPESKPAKKDVKVNIGADGVTVTDGSKDKEDEVYDEDGWSVRTVKKAKGFPRLALLWFIYSLVFVKRLGTTPGGKICRLAIVQYPGGAPIDKKQNLTRAFFSVISAYCAMLGYLWALFEKDRRGWHDLISGTCVVELPQ